MKLAASVRGHGRLPEGWMEILRSQISGCVSVTVVVQESLENVGHILGLSVCQASCGGSSGKIEGPGMCTSGEGRNEKGSHLARLGLYLLEALCLTRVVIRRREPMMCLKKRFKGVS